MSDNLHKPDSDPNQLISRNAILINGLPSSGKTTIAEHLVHYFDIPLLTLDTIKEAMFDTIGIGDREYNRMLSRACKAIIWQIITGFPKNSTVIIDEWYGYAPFDQVIKGLEIAGIKNFVEIWCHAPGEVLAKRYIERVDQRHIGHPGKEYGPELQEVVKRAKPMAIGKVLDIDSTDLSNIDYSYIQNWVAKELNLNPGSGNIDI